MVLHLYTYRIVPFYLLFFPALLMSELESVQGFKYLSQFVEFVTEEKRGRGAFVSINFTSCFLLSSSFFCIVGKKKLR